MHNVWVCALVMYVVCDQMLAIPFNFDRTLWQSVDDFPFLPELCDSQFMKHYQKDKCPCYVIKGILKWNTQEVWLQGW